MRSWPHSPQATPGSQLPQGGAAGGVRLREDVEDLVGTADDEVEPFERKRRPGTIAKEAANTDRPWQETAVLREWDPMTWRTGLNPMPRFLREFRRNKK